MKYSIYSRREHKYNVYLNGELNLGTNNKKRAEATYNKIKDMRKAYKKDWKIELVMSD